MAAIAALEAFALTAILQGFPIFAAASLTVKLLGDYRTGNTVLTVTLVTIFYSLLAISAGSTFPEAAANAYEAQFFNAGCPSLKRLLAGVPTSNVGATRGVGATAVVACGDNWTRN